MIIQPQLCETYSYIPLNYRTSDQRTNFVYRGTRGVVSSGDGVLKLPRRRELLTRTDIQDINTTSGHPSIDNAKKNLLPQNAQF